MKSAGRGIIRALPVCVLLLLLPGVSASSHLTANSFEFTGDGHSDAAAKLVHISSGSGVAIVGTGDIVRGQYFLTSEVNTVLIGTDDPTNCEPPSSVSEILDAGTCTSKTVLPEARGLEFGTDGNSANKNMIRAYSLDGSPFEVDQVVNSVTGLFSSDVQADGGREAAELESDSTVHSNQEPWVNDVAFFAARHIPGPVILSQADLRSPGISLTGNFVLEIWGPTLTVAGPNGESTSYETGQKLIAGDPATADVTEYRFLRLEIANGDISLVPGMGATVQVATSDLQMEAPTAELTVWEAILPKELDADPIGDAWVVHDVQSASFAAGSGTMEGNIEAASTATTVATPFMSDNQVQKAIWWSAGVIFILGFAVFLVRQHSVPPLPTIESALEAGHYHKAARLSNRIIRRDPRQESAQLTRAIAWSRIGKHQRIVRHLGSFLGQHEPNDGTLHYVLGLAYADAGLKAEARAAMAAAVLRTPSLMADVDPELRPNAMPLEGSAYS